MLQFSNLFKFPQNIKETMEYFEVEQEYENISLSKTNEIKFNLSQIVNKRDKFTAHIYEVNCRDNQVDIEDIESDDDLSIFENNVTLHLSIEKHILNGCLSVYDLNAFNTFLLGRKFGELIRILNSYILEKSVKKFSILSNPNIKIFCSDTFQICGENIPYKNSIISKREKTISYFLDISMLIGFNDIKFIPEDFENYFENNDYEKIQKLLAKCQNFFSIVFLVNKTKYMDDESFQVELETKVRHKELINYDSLLSEEYNKAYQIYRWAYSETVIDKVQIIRYFMLDDENSSISLNEETYEASIFSHKRFVNKELDKFIDVQNKSLVAIQDNQNKFRDLRNNIVSVFKVNSFTLAGFFISNYLVKQVDGSSQEGTDLLKKTGVSICALFAFYLLITGIQTIFEVQRLKKDYKNIQENLTKLFVEKYVEKYLPDSNINEEIKYIRKYSIVIFILWAIEIVFMLLVVLKLA